jgi:hypothetical protein
MSELAEGARLEIVCVVYSGTEGSNPSLSAISDIFELVLPGHGGLRVVEMKTARNVVSRCCTLSSGAL